MIQIKGNIILIGDTHFGVKRFSIEMLKNQIRFFNEQVFPYMEKNNIKQIFQFGDIFDNRTTVDIIWMDYIKKYFFDVLLDKDITLYTLKGNHDLALRETRRIALIDTFAEMYQNIKVFTEKEVIDINGFKTLIVPWLVKGEDLTYEDIKNMDYVFGHLELRNFEMTKGHCDTSAKLTKEFFEQSLNIKGVYSGHYHLKRDNGVIQYLGTPFQINFADYDEEKGFYDFDGINLEFFENTSSKKFIKVKYNDEDPSTDRNIEVSGLFKYSKLLTDEEYKILLPELDKHEIKFFINKAKDRHFDEILYTMKENKIHATVVDNQEISQIIGTDYIEDKELDVQEKDTRTLITDTVKEHKEDLLPLLLDIFREIDSTISKEV